MNPFTPKVRAVMRREFMHRVKSKWFLLSTLGLPLLIVGLMALSIFLALRGATDTSDETRSLGVSDPTGFVHELLVEELRSDSIVASRATELEGASVEVAQSRLADSPFDYLLVLPPGIVDAPGSGPAVGASDDEEAAILLARENLPAATERTVRNALERSLVRARLRFAGLEDVDAGELLSGAGVEVVNVTETGEARDQEIYQGISFGIAFFFYLILLIYGQMIIRSILEEKQSDIVEVMVSSLRPWELMLGKIVGVGAVGLAQMAIWAGIMIAATIYGLTGGASTLAEAGVDLSSVAVPWGTIGLVLAFLVLGYLLYAGLFAGTGATISNETDAQQAALPVTMLIILPFIAIQGVIQSPDAGWAVIVSLVPFFSPLVMTSRLFVTDVPFWQWTLSLGLLALCVLGSAWVAGRIYRVGILMKGQRPNLPEVVRWIRHG
ncbi:MAG: ABC transporter permease [Gemmatimonadetes bacterium]|nr:ABC transporter permease [Gemmatimonadota bacterium]